MTTYLQIDPVSKKVIGVSNLKSDVDAENLIKIQTGEEAYEFMGRIYDPSTGEFSDDPLTATINTRPNITVTTSMPEVIEGRVTIAAGATVSLTIDIKDSEGNHVPLSDTFAVPIRRIGGAVERTVGVTFTDGMASNDISWPSSGEFEITEDLINMHLPREQHFKFERLVFSVYE